MVAWLLAAWVALGAVPTEALEAMLDREVVVVRTDGSEVPGKLVGVGEETATVLKHDGRVVSVPLGEVEALRGEPAVPPTSEPPRAAQATLSVSGGGTRLVAARFGRDELILADGGSFAAGRALRGYQFVDDQGRLISQQQGWQLMGRGQEFRRRGRSGLKVALDLVTCGCAAGILVVMIDGKSSNDRLAGPLAIVGLSGTFAGFAVSTSLQRRRGEEGLRLARERYGR